MAKRIAILGAGPAGSATALGLVDRGVDPGDLVVLDKAIFPRPKLCGGALTFRGTEALGALLGQPPGGGETRSLVFRSTLGSFDIREKGGQWLYDRAVLDHELVKAVEARGVEVRQGCAVQGLEPGTDGWRVRTRAGVETFPFVVGADGAAGLSRRASQLPGGILGRLVEAVFEPTTAALDPSVLYFDFDPICDGIPGYAWIFPYPKPGADGLWKLGIMDGRGVVPGQALRDWTLAFADRFGFRMVEEKLAGWPERYFQKSARAHRPGLVLVGEAWGIDPLLGEGIAPSLEMARYAAGRLKEALDAGTSTIPGYETRFHATEEGENLRFQARLADLLYGDKPHRWLRVLFENRSMHEMAASGEEAYGRLRKHLWRLVFGYAAQVVRQGGLPSAARVAPDYAAS